jgi:hypothetical protein
MRPIRAGGLCRGTTPKTCEALLAGKATIEIQQWQVTQSDQPSTLPPLIPDRYDAPSPPQNYRPRTSTLIHPHRLNPALPSLHSHPTFAPTSPPALGVTTTPSLPVTVVKQSKLSCSRHFPSSPSPNANSNSSTSRVTMHRISARPSCLPTQDHVLSEKGKKADLLRISEGFVVQRVGV